MNVETNFFLRSSEIEMKCIFIKVYGVVSVVEN